MVPHATGRYLVLALLLYSPLAGFPIPAEVHTLEFEPAFIAGERAIAADPTLDLGFAYSEDNGILYAFRLSTGEEMDRLIWDQFGFLFYDPATRTLMGSPANYNSSSSRWISDLLIMPIMATPVTGEVFDEDSAGELPVPDVDTSVWPHEQWNSTPVIDSERGLCFLTSIQNEGEDDDALRLHAIDLSRRAVVDTLDLPLINAHWTFYDSASQRITLAEAGDDPEFFVVDASGASPEILVGHSPTMDSSVWENVYIDIRPAYLGDVGFTVSNDGRGIRAFDVNTGERRGFIVIPTCSQQLRADPVSSAVYTHLTPWQPSAEQYGPHVYRIPVDPNESEVFEETVSTVDPVLLEIPDGWDREPQDGVFIDVQRDLIITSCDDHIFAHSLSTLELLDTVETGRGTFDTTRWQPATHTLTRIDEHSIGYTDPPGTGALIYPFDGPSDHPLSGPNLFEKPDGIILESRIDVGLDGTDRLVIFPQATQGELVALNLASEEVVRHSVSTTMDRGLARDRGLLNRVATQGSHRSLWHVAPDDDPPLTEHLQVGHYTTFDPDSMMLFDEMRGLAMWIWPTGPVTPRNHLAVASPEYLSATYLDLGIVAPADDLLLQQMCPLGPRVVIQDDSRREVFHIVNISDETLASPESPEIWTVNLEDLLDSGERLEDESLVCDATGRLGFTLTIDQLYKHRVAVIDLASPMIINRIDSWDIPGGYQTIPGFPFTTPDGEWLCFPIVGQWTRSLAVIRIDPDVPGALVGDWTLVPLITLPYGGYPKPLSLTFVGNLLLFPDGSGRVNRIDWQTWENLGPVHLPAGSLFRDASSDGAFLIATGGEFSNLLHIITVPPPVEIQGLILE